MSILPLRPLGFGEIVDGAFQLYRKDFGRYYLVCLIATFPVFVLNMVASPGAGDFAVMEQALNLAEEDPGAAFGAMMPMMYTLIWLSLAASLFSWFAVLAAMAAMADKVEGGRVGVQRAFARAFRTLPRALGASLVAFICTAVAWFVLAMFFALASAALGTMLGPIAVIALLFVFLVVAIAGMLLVAGATCLVVPAVVVEHLGPLASLRRAITLCGGGWLTVLGVMVVALIIHFVPSTGVAALVDLPMWFATPDEIGQVSAMQIWVSNAVSLVVAPLTLPFLAGSFIVLHHDRRVRLEGYDLEVLARSLDDGAR